ncbi:MAG: lytic transglycosylase domain-containing protein [Lachnospirales bacterium]
MKIFKVLCCVLLIFIAFMSFKIYFKPSHLDLIYKYSEKYGLEPELVSAIIRTESKFDQFATSHKGAKGYMQLMEGTADWGASMIDLEGYSYEDIFDPEINIELGCWYVSNLIKEFGDIDTAIVAYNAGSGNVTRWLKEQEIDKIDKKNIPFKESENYLKRVNRNYKIYKLYLRYIGEKI